MTGSRLEKGGLIDRRQKVTFRFNGRSVTGFKGDTIASALLASGHMLVGRSFKYHRPRGGDVSWCGRRRGLVQYR